MKPKKQTLEQRMDELERYVTEIMQIFAERFGYQRGRLDTLERMMHGKKRKK